jgi:hypothetical protein
MSTLTTNSVYLTSSREAPVLAMRLKTEGKGASLQVNDEFDGEGANGAPKRYFMYRGRHFNFHGLRAFAGHLLQDQLRRVRVASESAQLKLQTVAATVTRKKKAATKAADEKARYTAAQKAAEEEAAEESAALLSHTPEPELTLAAGRAGRLFAALKNKIGKIRPRKEASTGVDANPRCLQAGIMVCACVLGHGSTFNVSFCVVLCAALCCAMLCCVVLAKNTLCLVLC